jgi:hypothetical protein
MLHAFGWVAAGLGIGTYVAGRRIGHVGDDHGILRGAGSDQNYGVRAELRADRLGDNLHGAAGCRGLHGPTGCHEAPRRYGRA